MLRRRHPSPSVEQRDVSILCSRHLVDGRPCGRPLLVVDARALAAADAPPSLVVVECRRCHAEWWLTTSDLVDAVAPAVLGGASAAWLRVGSGRPAVDPTDPVPV